MIVSVRSVRDVDLGGKRVMVRADFEVLVEKDGRILDQDRILDILPTIKYIQANNAKCVVLVGHIGVEDSYGPDPNFSLLPVAKVISRRLRQPIDFINESRGSCVLRIINEAVNGKVVILENLKFNDEEVVGDDDEDGSDKSVVEFRRELSEMCDVYVNDSFRLVHLNLSSIVGVEAPVRVAGLAFEKVLRMFRGLVDGTQKPSVAIVGGDDLERKLELMLALIGYSVDYLLLAGKIALLFAYVQRRHAVGDYELQEYADSAQMILDRAEKQKVIIRCPADFACVRRKDGKLFVFDEKIGIRKGYDCVDIGPQTIRAYKETIEEANTVFWFGLLGDFKEEKSETGTRELMQFLSAQTSINEAVAVIGEEKTADAVHKLNLQKGFSYVGKNEVMDFVEGKKMEGLEVLLSRSTRKSLAIKSGVRSSVMIKELMRDMIDAMLKNDL